MPHGIMVGGLHDVELVAIGRLQSGEQGLGVIDPELHDGAVMDAKTCVTPSALSANGVGPPVPPAFMTTECSGPAKAASADLTESKSVRSIRTTEKMDLPVRRSRSL